MTEEIKKPIIRRKIKLPEQTEKIETTIKSPESETFFEEPLSKDETLVKNSIEDLGISLGIKRICNAENCEEIDCTHFKLHDKIRTCGEVCGVHSETKCI